MPGFQHHSIFRAFGCLLNLQLRMALFSIVVGPSVFLCNYHMCPSRISLHAL
ncbi:Uncharacterized protein APZ42_000825 [Daphnia magna]|uniref:Uncharacterized protein n=1 Tax=Daphnia magna TaxID=35525 RepID=A0A164JCR5_9CRUS|nr:Uncharacterized protein APZ42_000825 [Daphnia magna]